MAKRIEIRIRDQVYPILAEENESYLQLCAGIVNHELSEVMDGSRLTLSDGAILAALNIADKYCKEREVSDSLRSQLKDALDENVRLTREAAAPKPQKATRTRGAKGAKGAKADEAAEPAPEAAPLETVSAVLAETSEPPEAE